MDKKYIYIIIALVIIVVVFAIFNKSEGKPSGDKDCKNIKAPFDYVACLGAVKAVNSNGTFRNQFGLYGFYDNNRVIMGPGVTKKGSYDTTQITWEDGTKTPLKDIFK